MHAEALRALKNLLLGARVAVLGVLVEGAPYTGLLPYAMHPTFHAVHIHASDLARHTAGLTPGARFSLLIHAPETPQDDPLQLPRVTLQGAVAKLEKGSAAYQQGQHVYKTRFPTSHTTFRLKDFNLYALEIHRGRFVAGFAQAYNLSPATLRRLAELE